MKTIQVRAYLLVYWKYKMYFQLSFVRESDYVLFDWKELQSH